MVEVEIKNYDCSYPARNYFVDGCGELENYCLSGGIFRVVDRKSCCRGLGSIAGLNIGDNYIYSWLDFVGRGGVRISTNSGESESGSIDRGCCRLVWSPDRKLAGYVVGKVHTEGLDLNEDAEIS